MLTTWPGPFRNLLKQDLPGLALCRHGGVAAPRPPGPRGWFDLVHSHYWLSGQVGWLSKER